MDYLSRLEEWKNRGDEATRAELSALPQKELEERFYTELSFGTAGLRGVIGAGTNRINAYVVRRATQGLANYLVNVKGARERGVAIAYDSRRFSDDFARTAALVLANNGIRVYLFDALRAVPQLSFAIRHFHCMAGIVITASHNPSNYNGYKVYWEHGGQIGPQQAEEVLRAISHVNYFDVQEMDEAQAKKSGILHIVGAEVDEAYYAATQTLLLNAGLLKERGGDLSIVYTPLFGAGYRPVTALLSRVGVKHVHVVSEQAQPNWEFPNLSAPNPEDPNAFSLAIKLADAVNADTILATDPDSDRLGVAVRTKHDGFRVLSGNQIGCLLLEYIVSMLNIQQRLPKNALVVKSLVSTQLANAICDKNGVQLDTVLTGFRFISEKIDEAERTKAHTFLFGFEESYGFLAGGFSRDKDAICAAMLVAEACVYYKTQGMTLICALEAMYKKYGYYKESVKSYTLEGKAGLERIAGAMRALRESPLYTLSHMEIAIAEDYSASVSRNMQTGEESAISLPSSDMLRYVFSNGAWIVVRPSGTEPKLKLYIGANAPKEEEVDALLHTLMRAADALLSGYLY